MPELDLTSHRRVHIVGVGGAAMSAIASVLMRLGHQVTGSDLKSSARTDRLIATGIDVQIGHRAENLADADVVARSTAIPDSNPEVVAARAVGIEVLSRADVQAALCDLRRTIAVSGSHGKTTTSAMLALVLAEAGLRPSYLLGAELNEIGSNALWDDGEWLVVEADESDGTFLELPAELAVVTSVEPDHLGYWGSFENLVAGFRQFLADGSGPRIVCADDPEAAHLGEEIGAVTYGTSEGAAWRMTDLRSARSSCRFLLIPAGGGDAIDIRLAVPGAHNARNAAAAVVTAFLIGVPLETAARALARYAGVTRRMQFRGERDGITYIDDYAHLPTEVAAALDAAGGGGWRRVVCVFQPHRYSRTADLWADFRDAFDRADHVVITDVYAENEAPRPGITGKLVAQAVLDAHPGRSLAWLPSRRHLAAYLRQLLRPGDLCLTLGAGDITLLPDELLRA